MASFNLVVVMGNLGADPEIRQAGDAQVANFRIACSERWKDKNTGELRENTEWVTIVAWRGLASIAQNYLHKGSPVLVEGKLKTRKWQGSDGSDRYATEVVADKIELLGSRRDASEQPQGLGNPGGQQASSNPWMTSGGSRDYSGRGQGSSPPADDPLPF